MPRGARAGIAACFGIGVLGLLARVAGAGEVGTNDARLSDMGPDGNTNFSAFAPICAFNSAANEFLVIWLADDAAPLADNELEIFAQRIDAATGAQVGTNDFRISAMGPDGNVNFIASRCAIAYNATSNEFLAVWRGEDNVGGLVDGEFEIFGQRLSASGAEVGADDFRISAMGGTGSTAAVADVPAVAWNSTNNEYLVAWRGHETNAMLGTVVDEFEIWGQRLDASGNLLGGKIRISDAGPNGNINFAALDPDVAYNPVNNEYLVVWRADDTTDNEIEVYGQRLNAASGAEVGTNDFRISDMGPDTNTNFIGDSPSVAHNAITNQYLVVWHGDDNTAPLVNDEFEIFGQLLDGATGAAVGANDFRISDVGTDGNVNTGALSPRVAWNASTNEYLVVFQADETDSEAEVLAQRISAAGALVGQNDFRLSDMGPDGNTSFGAFEPRVAAGGGNGFLIVWRGDDNTAPLVDEEIEVFGQLFSTASATSITSIVPNPSVVGQAVTVNYAVSGAGGTPTGSVTVTDGAASCNGTVAAGNCTLTFTAVGARSVTATYAGDTDFSASTSAAVTQTVTQGTTTTTISSITPNPALVGQSVTIAYSVTSPFGAPSGDVTVSVGANAVCTGTVTSGSCVTTFATAGTLDLAATYAGDANFLGSTSATASLAVTPAPTTTTIMSVAPSPATTGAPVTVTFSVTSTTGTPTGTVVITDGTQSCTSDVATGNCTLTFTAAGTRSLTAVYAGDANFAASSSSPIELVVSSSGGGGGGGGGTDDDGDGTIDDDEMPAGCGAGLCGAGMLTLTPVALLTLLGVRRLYRPRYRR